MWEPVSIKATNVAYYVGNNGPPWLCRGNCPQVVAGIPEVWCVPKVAVGIAIASGQVVPILGIYLQEWRRLDALYSLCRTAQSTWGLLPEIRSWGKPGSWSHQHQVQGDPGNSEMGAYLSSRICCLGNLRPESWVLLIGSQYLQAM